MVASPFYQGYTNSRLIKETIDNQREEVTLDRFKQHTQICSSCTKAYQTTIRSKQILIVIAIATSATAIISESSQIKILLVTSSMLSVILTAIAKYIKTKFERSYIRHSQKNLRF